MSEILEPFATVRVQNRTINVDGGSITLDEMSVPYAHGTLNVPLDDETLGESLDPRDGLRAVLEVGDRRGAARTLDLVLTRRAVRHTTASGSTLDLSVASDEALLIAWSQLVNDTGALALKGSARAICNYVLGKAIGAALANGSTDFNFTTTDAEDDTFTWEPGVTAWDFLRPLLTTAGLRLYCDENRVWRLVDPTRHALPGTLSVVPARTTDGQDAIRIDDPDVWCTGVVVVYRWQDATGSQRIRRDTAGTPGRVLVVEYDRAWPGAGAARAIYNRRKGQGRTQAATVLAAWDAIPSQRVDIQFPGTPSTTGRLVAATWGLTDGLMQITTTGLIEAAEPTP